MKARIGLVLLVLVVAAVAAVQLVLKRGGSAPGGGGVPGGTPAAGSVVVKGLIGGEKTGLLESAEIQQMLAKKYGLRVDATRRGSIEMVQDAVPAGTDFLWPSSQVATEIYKEKKGKLEKTEILLNSPIVLYSWDKVTDALIKQAIVKRTGEAYYIVDFPKLVKLINAGTKWSDIGIPEIYGKVTVFSTDPTKSNSGNQFAGLLANVANGGEVAGTESLAKVTPIVDAFFGRLGMMPTSSSDMFKDYLSQGIGGRPMIAGYESQLIEFTIQNPSIRKQVDQEIRILYPRPTVWSSHPFISLTPNGTRLLTALQDPEIQKLAWSQHGFRSGIPGIPNDPKTLGIPGIPARVEGVIPMPNARVMEHLIQSLTK